MLKLVSSTYRYILLNESLCPYIHHIKQFTSITKNRICTTKQLSTIISPVDLIFDPGHQLRTLAKESKKRNEPTKMKKKQISDSFYPNSSHNSHGGVFQVSMGDDGSNIDRGQRDNSRNNNHEHNGPCTSIPMPSRTWEVVGKKVDRREGKSFSFKIVSYNVLAQYLLECHPYLYKTCSPESLRWKERADLLFDEITKLAPDVLCLQEVQLSHLHTFFGRFERLGYHGIFKCKTGRRQDGCAIYFKQSVFSLEDHISVEFYQPELPILNRDNIGIMIKLVPHCLPESPIVFATTHLLYNPKRTDVRLAQLQVFLAEIDRFSYINDVRGQGHLPIIITGDFNSTPESAVIQLLDRGHVSAGSLRDSSDWKKIGVTDNCQHLSVYLNRQKGEVMTDQRMIKIFNSEYCSSNSDVNLTDYTSDYNGLFNSGVLAHYLELISVYDKIKQNGQYEATTYQDDWVTVDYIYFSNHNSLRLTERLRLPTAEDCKLLDRLPNHIYGSDHLSLGAVFEMKSVKCSL